MWSDFKHGFLFWGLDGKLRKGSVCVIANILAPGLSKIGARLGCFDLLRFSVYW